jgi:pimeloyl-ACP methyl ester carboxylesterase
MRIRKKTGILTIASILIFSASFAFAIPNKNTTIQIQIFPLERKGFKLFLERIQSIKSPKNKALPYPDILLVHGLTYSSHQFDLNYQDYSLARYLAKQGARVWLLDITGYGRSAKPQNGFVVNGEYAAEDIAAAVASIRQEQKVAKVNLLGWSFGTISTSLMAAKHPTWINKLILYAPIYHGLGLPAPINAYQSFSLKAAAEDFQKEEGGDTLDPSITDPKLLVQYLKQAQLYDGKESPNGTRQDLFQEKTVALFNPAQLTMPVLVIGGKRDPYLNWPKDIPFIMQILPHKKSRLVTIAGAGHLLMLEQPYHRRFQKAVWDFMSE